jgi:release factor glutamine methyltransferase
MSGGRSDERVWTVLDLLRFTTDHFAKVGIESARLDAEILLAFALGVERMQVYLQFDKPVLASERATFRELVRRRASDRVPVAHLTGTREFWSLPLRVTPEVLVPRPETETLVEAALARFLAEEGELRALELGTGSGAVALALLAERKRARVVATDVSASALRLAASNAEQLGMADRIELREGDLFEPVAGERFDLVVSNPPYLALSEASGLAPELANPPYLALSEASGLAPELAHEPERALFAGPGGLEVLERVVEGAPEALLPGGWLALETAPDQAEGVRAACARQGLVEAAVVRDLGGRPRVVVARRAPAGGG